VIRAGGYEVVFTYRVDDEGKIVALRRVLGIRPGHRRRAQDLGMPDKCLGRGA